MSDFYPDGYLSTKGAIARAAEYWFPERFNELEIPPTPQSATKPESHIEEAVRAFSQPQIPRVWQDAFENIARQTVQRLRNLLHQGKLNAYYFDDSRHAVPCEFWATAPADGVLESGYYSPPGPQIRMLEWRTNFPLCLLESELDRLLNEPSSKKRPLPRSKMPEIVAALRKLADLPNRRAQYEALCELPEFREYKKITDAVFREAARQLPRDPGRKPRRQS